MSYEPTPCDKSSLSQMVSPKQKCNSLRGQATTSNVLEYMKNQSELLVNVEDIEKNFEHSRDIMTTLKTMGDIYEPKPGRYMILE